MCPCTWKSITSVTIFGKITSTLVQDLQLVKCQTSKCQISPWRKKIYKICCPLLLRKKTKSIFYMSSSIIRIYSTEIIAYDHSVKLRAKKKSEVSEIRFLKCTGLIEKRCISKNIDSISLGIQNPHLSVIFTVQHWKLQWHLPETPLPKLVTTSKSDLFLCLFLVQIHTVEQLANVFCFPQLYFAFPCTSVTSVPWLHLSRIQPFTCFQVIHTSARELRILYLTAPQCSSICSITLT